MSLAVVTGAASGVGAAVAALLAEQGVPTIGVDVNDGPGSWVRGDVADPETWRRVVEVADGRTVDRLVLAAAVLEVGTALQVTADALRRVMDVNVVGALLGVQACLPGMLAAGGGRIVAVASVDAFLAEQGLAAYCASKGALLQLIRCVAVDYARAGIRANCVCPAAIDTPFFRQHVDAAADPVEFLRVKTERHPAGRILDPADVAHAVMFLLSDAAIGINGTGLTVDGALTATFAYDASAVS